jgi:REP element-mobilizing transposase RayT
MEKQLKIWEEESEVIRKLKEQIEKKAFEIETLQSELEHLHWLVEELRKQLRGESW